MLCNIIKTTAHLGAHDQFRKVHGKFQWSLPYHLLYKPLHSVSPQLKGMFFISSSVSRCLALVRSQSNMQCIYSASQSHQARSCLNIVLRLLFKVTALYVMTARLRRPAAIEPPVQAHLTTLCTKQ